MVVTAELSLYPLTTDYEGPILAFIKALKKHDEIQVLTHSMSTYVKGESKAVFNAVEVALSETPDTVSLVIKTINRDLPVEQGFLKF